MGLILCCTWEKLPQGRQNKLEVGAVSGFREVGHPCWSLRSSGGEARRGGTWLWGHSPGLALEPVTTFLCVLVQWLGLSGPQSGKLSVT